MDDVANKAPKPQAATVRYDDDTYSWAFEQAALLRAGKWSELDIEHLADEIEDVGKSEKWKLESALRLVLMHLLKWDHQPDKRTRSWTLSIAVHRKTAARMLRENPGLKGVLAEVLANAYDTARLDASGETDLDLSVFPEACPYDVDAIMTRPIEWPAAGRDSDSFKD
jgi:predicted DNA-binding ribbon-helix-helix protein